MASFPPGSLWQFHCGIRKDWVSCKPDEDAKLKEAYRKISEADPTCVYSLNNVKFRADFSRMTRTNLASLREVSLRLQGGDLPSPVPKPSSEPAEVPKKPTIPRKSFEAPGSDAIAAMTPEERAQMEEFENKWNKYVDWEPNVSGNCEFSVELSEKDDFNEIFVYKLMEAGIRPENIAKHYLAITDANGRKVAREDDKMQEVINNPRSYPIVVKYDAPESMRELPPERHIEKIRDEILLKYIAECIDEVKTIDEVKHNHQKNVWERYKLYVLDGDPFKHDSRSAAEMREAYQHQISAADSVMKSGPNLARILRGQEDILSFLFGS